MSEWEGKRGAKFLFGGVDLAEYFEQAHRLLKTNKEAWKVGHSFENIRYSHSSLLVLIIIWLLSTSNVKIEY